MRPELTAATQYGENVPETDVRLIFVRSEYITVRYISTMSKIDSEKQFVDAGKLGREPHRILSTDSFSSSGEREQFSTSFCWWRKGKLRMDCERSTSV